MGCGTSSSNIVINFDQTNQLFFGGEIVSRTVQLYVNEDNKLEANEVDMGLLGDIGYSTTHTDANGSTRTDHHYVQFLRLKYVLACLEDGEKQLTYTQGCHSWPFQFQLPDELPPTMNVPQRYPHVRYYIVVLIVKSGYRRNIRENRFMKVFPHVSLQKQPNCLMKTMFGNHNRKGFTVKGVLNKLGYIPGETIKGTMEIENTQRVLIKQVDLSIIGTYHIVVQSASFNVTSCTMPEIVNRKEGQIVQPFELVFPSSILPPSYQFKGGLTVVATAECSYMLKIGVKVEGMFTDFEVLIPIILGTEP